MEYGQENHVTKTRNSIQARTGRTAAKESTVKAPQLLKLKLTSSHHCSNQSSGQGLINAPLGRLGGGGIGLLDLDKRRRRNFFMAGFLKHVVTFGLLMIGTSTLQSTPGVARLKMGHH